MNFFEELISKLSVKTIGTHLANYASLYTKPLKTWRKVISNRKDGYDLMILHLIYYCIFLFLIIKNITTTISLVLLEAVITIIPTLVFITPFLLFVKLYKKKIRWTKMFRLFLILKLQFIPVFILSYIAVDWLKIESLYLITENQIWLIWFAFILIPPLIINIPFWKKVIWVLGNYVSCLIFLLITALTLTKIDFDGKGTDRLILKTPNAEYTEFLTKYTYPALIFDDGHYLIVFSKDSSNEKVPVNPQFVSLELWELFTKNYENELDSQLNKTIAHPNEKKITISLLQKIKSETNKRFYAMFETVKKLKDSSQFDSNREYFAALHNYLYVYDSSYSHSEQVRKIMANSVDESYLNLENNNIAIMLKVDSNTYKPFKQEYIKYERKMTDRSAKSYLLMNIFTYPADIILDRLGFYG